MMGEKWEKILSKAIGVKPIMINSSLVSAQNRQRLYWTNIGLEPQGLFGDLESIIQQPKDKQIFLKDILQEEVEQKYFLSEKMIASFGKPTEVFNNETIITHNLQRRSADRPALKDNKNAGGSGHLSKADGKTYCLDIGNTQAVEIVGGDLRFDVGFRWREGGKSGTLMAQARNDGTAGQALAKINNIIRRLTPVECERLQTVKDNYTNHVSDSQRYKMLGNGWTIDVIVHILNYIK